MEGKLIQITDDVGPNEFLDGCFCNFVITKNRHIKQLDYKGHFKNKQVDIVFDRYVPVYFGKFMEEEVDENPVYPKSEAEIAQMLELPIENFCDNTGPWNSV